VGAVDYLNVRPLVYGLAEDADIALRFDSPAVCADLLASGAIDLGMVPSISHATRPADAIVPGLCIGSDGPVASVAIFSRTPLREVRTLALDTSSRTSAALTRILCARRFLIAPVFVPRPPVLEAMLAAADAALLIGDPALFADHRALGADKIDLGAAWTEMTSLPFVWAFWAGPAGGAGGRLVTRLQRAASAGMVRSDALADAYCADDLARQALARRYLRDHLLFRLTARALDGLRAYYREAHALGLVAAEPALTFFPDGGGHDPF
jgi:predicted solute-binding protein